VPGELSRGMLFGADDIDATRLDGLIAFLFACYGAGTPETDHFLPEAVTGVSRIAPAPFTARLAQRLLARGAAAVVGHAQRLQRTRPAPRPHPQRRARRSAPRKTIFAPLRGRVGCERILAGQDTQRPLGAHARICLPHGAPMTSRIRYYGLHSMPHDTNDTKSLGERNQDYTNGH
jgi:hypothetical protein